VCADFRNCEEELKNALATSRSKIHNLEGKVWEIEAGGLELKRAMKEATESEYAVRVKSHYPEVDMTKIKGGADTTEDHHALELEVDEAATEVAESIDFEGDDGAGGEGGDGDNQ
jgi:hypothetical protein